MLTYYIHRSIKFYRTVGGKCPLEDFLDSLSDKAAQKTLAVFKFVETERVIPRKFFKKLSGSDLWEIRVSWEKNIYRYLCFLQKNALVILTHGFVKKSQKTPKGEIERALKYRNDYIRRNNDG